MPQANLTLHVREAAPGVAVVDIQGEVTAFAEQALIDADVQASAYEARTIVLNFRELEYMNSGGIGQLVTLLIRANRAGQRLVAIGLSAHYREIFEVTRLTEAIHVYDSESEALAAARIG